MIMDIKTRRLLMSYGSQALDLAYQPFKAKRASNNQRQLYYV